MQFPLRISSSPLLFLLLFFQVFMCSLFIFPLDGESFSFHFYRGWQNVYLDQQKIRVLEKKSWTSSIIQDIYYLYILLIYSLTLFHSLIISSTSRFVIVEELLINVHSDSRISTYSNITFIVKWILLIYYLSECTKGGLE